MLGKRLKSEILDCDNCSYTDDEDMLSLSLSTHKYRERCMERFVKRLFGEVSRKL